MSQRPGILVTERRESPRPPWPYPDLPDPRSQVPEINAEIRSHWPHWAERDEVLAVLTEAYRRAVEEVTTR